MTVKHALTAFALLLALTTSAAASTAASCPSVGIYTSADIAKKQAEVGVKFDHVLKFQTIDKLDHSKLTKFLDAGFGVILNIEFEAKFPNLKDIAAGRYDDKLQAFAAAAKKDGRELWLRPLHEANGDWYNWAVFYDPSVTMADYHAAFRHIVNLMRAAGAPVKFQLNYNRKNGKKKTNPMAELYPGDDYVDRVVITNYNRAYTTKAHQFWHTFAEDFQDAYDQVTAMTKRPIGVAEMSSTSKNGDKPAWIREAFTDLTTKFPQVAEVTWFAYNRPMNGDVWDWDLNTDAERQAFRDGVAAFRKGRGC